MVSFLAFVAPFLVAASGSFVAEPNAYDIGTFDGRIVAFGDLNGDKSTDVVLAKGSHLNVALWSRSTNAFALENPIDAQDAIETIRGVELADFDGDDRLDALAFGNDQSVVLWGAPPAADAIFDDERTPIDACRSNESLVIDWNGDLLPDIRTTSCSTGKPIVLASNPNRTFTRLVADETTIDVASSSFVDLNGDCVADFWSSTYNRARARNVFVVRVRGASAWQQANRFEIPSDRAVVSPSFADVNADGSIDVVVVVNGSTVVAYLNRPQSSTDCVAIDDFGSAFRRHWIVLEADFSFSPWIRVGDVNLDAYPDLLVVRDRKAVLLINTESSSSSKDRTFEMYKGAPLGVDGSAEDALFFDLEDDGIMDILVVIAEGETRTTIPILNQLYSDSEFLRVTVLSGYCPETSDSCDGTGSSQFAVPQIGALIKFSTTGPQGGRLVSAAAHSSVSGSYACGLPYVVFGLSLTSNFVEKLSVGIPYVNGSKLPLSRTWKSIIPNSHLYILSKPGGKPSEWRNVLYLTPSNKVWYTLAVFAGTCLFFGITVGLLHWREKRQDEREKRQEAHKFHFDAM
ncbi:T-cell immunomodulatory protein-like [Oscarella lobularis]|uniref:T-cell immunomodulatory protein-like n=1 Tax=Oscarella lobularis TaxID=121494 RepID=UPI003313BCC1